MTAKAIDRVRCVLARKDRYLLVLHNNRLPENYGKWGLPGGVLDNGEEPTTGLRRELKEEFHMSKSEIFKKAFEKFLQDYKKQKLKKIAELMASEYEKDEELTSFTSLDAEDFK